jgi:hypothetical protein
MAARMQTSVKTKSVEAQPFDVLAPSEENAIQSVQTTAL